MKKTIYLLIALLSPLFAVAEPTFFELRTYHTHPGKLDALHARFSDHTIGLFEKHGMTNIGYWTPQDQPDTLTYLMGYPSEEAREASWKAFLNDPTWKAAYKASTADGKLVAKIESTYLTPTDYNPGFKIEAQDPARLFELRIYTTNDGKLDDLHKRFADHTVELFTKHGIHNLGYYIPTRKEDGAGSKLIYFVFHKDEASRGAAFKAFSQDPAWKSAKEASEAEGPILVKKGVTKTFLIPTPYSPSK